MGRNLLLLMGFLLLGGTVLFFSCGNPNNGNFLTGTASVTVNNPMAGQQILLAVCNKLVQGHAGLAFDNCTTGVGSTSFGSALGVPPGIFDPYGTLLSAEQENQVIGNFSPMNVCITDINALDPNSKAVQDGYNSSAHNPFEFVIDMIPGDSGSCVNVYTSSVFAPELIPAPYAPPTGVTLVNFTNPAAPSGPPNSLVGSYEGFNFMNQWRWEGPFNADTGNSIYFANSTLPGSGQFSMPSSTTLVSVNVFNADFSGGTGTLTVSDASGVNATVTQSVAADGNLHRVYTQWTNTVVNPITVTFSDGTMAPWVLGIADIEYK